MSRLERLGERYRQQQRSERGPNFVWGGEDRIEPLRRAVGGPGLDVLDIGCRDGALTRHFAAGAAGVGGKAAGARPETASPSAPQGNRVVGLDADREALAQAAKLGIETVWADAEEPLPFANEAFDVVVVAEVLEHLREPQLLVDEAARVLRPDGAIVGSVPNAYRLKNRLRYLAGRPPEANPTHLHLFRPADVRALLAGFGERRLEYVVGRFVRVHPRLFANVIVFTARKPR